MYHVVWPLPGCCTFSNTGSLLPVFTVYCVLNMSCKFLYSKPPQSIPPFANYLDRHSSHHGANSSQLALSPAERGYSGS